MDVAKSRKAKKMRILLQQQNRTSVSSPSVTSLVYHRAVFHFLFCKGHLSQCPSSDSPLNMQVWKNRFANFTIPGQSQIDDGQTNPFHNPFATVTWNENAGKRIVYWSATSGLVSADTGFASGSLVSTGAGAAASCWGAASASEEVQRVYGKY